MAGSINKVILVGNLGRDPEIRSTQTGKEIANLTIATSESWKDKMSGERREKTEWHRVVIFNDGLVNIAKNYLKKGSKVYLEGQLQTRKWEDQSGQERYTTEVVLQGFNCNLTMLDGKRDSAESFGSSGGEMAAPEPAEFATANNGGFGGGGGTGTATTEAAEEILDDEIPF